MIAKKPTVKAKSSTHPTEAKVNKFIRKAQATPSTNGHVVVGHVLLKVPTDLLDWLTAEAAKDSRPRNFYMLRILEDHRAKTERGE